MLSTITVTGWVKEDFSFMTSEEGVTYVRFDLSVQKGYGKTERREFYECLAYGDTAQRILNAHVKGGCFIQLTGDLEIRDYERKDGSKTKIPKITVYNWCYVPRIKEKEDNVKS